MKVEKQGGSIVAEVDIAAAPDVVFAALVDPRQLAQWWGSDDSYRTTNWRIDPRRGGRWSCEGFYTKDGGDRFTISGVYEEFDPPRVLTYMWNPSMHQIPETRVRITLEATPTGTRLRLVHSGFAGQERAAEGHTQGWTRVLGWLEQYCRGKKTQS